MAVWQDTVFTGSEDMEIKVCPFGDRPPCVPPPPPTSGWLHPQAYVNWHCLSTLGIQTLQIVIW